jgi:hypothetical protein
MLGASAPQSHAPLQQPQSQNTPPARCLDRAMVDEFLSGPIVLSWHKLRRYIEERRREQGRETIEACFQ